MRNEYFENFKACFRGEEYLPHILEEKKPTLQRLIAETVFLSLLGNVMENSKTNDHSLKQVAL